MSNIFLNCLRLHLTKVLVRAIAITLLASKVSINEYFSTEMEFSKVITLFFLNTNWN